MVDDLVSAEILKAAKSHIKELTEKWTSGELGGDGGICWGACWDLKGKDLVRIHDACHSWVSNVFRNMKECTYYDWSSGYKDSAKPFLTLTCHSKERVKTMCSGEAMDAIILWMARESPFSQYVLNRDDDDSLLNGGAILLCGPGGLSHTEAMWVCKVLRYGNEGGKALEAWLTLYKGGVNPLIALLVGSHTRTAKGATFGYTGQYIHSSVFADSAPDVLALLHTKLNLNANNTGEVFHSFETAKLSSRSRKDVSTIVQGFCQPVLKDDGWGNKVMGEGVDAPDFIEKVLAWQNDMEKRWENASKPKEPKPMPTAETIYLEVDL
jgi:hypothetical protein